jgi:hypothetical protein
VLAVKPSEFNVTTSVSTTFTYSRKEYIRAMQRHYYSNLHARRDVVGGLLGIVGGLYLALAMDLGWIGWCLVGVSCFLLVIVAYAMLLLPALIYASQPKLKNEYVLSFTDEGIRFKTEGIDATLQWSLYHRWLSDDRFYVMYHGKRNLTVIPRRALANDDADNTFRQLLTEHVGKPQP